ncbi:type II toxin-antitoxin system RelE/ParE family toxin, partial [Mycobacterium tuberculosis]|uniref:type II toxin-antitoxin system RelE/ParE family toxin n=1 Tax=Mycobacterium tuberculosis TaxID=1773 RepID=UPI003F6651B3
TLNARDQPPAEVSDQRVSGLTGAVHIEVLEEEGPALGCPLADTVRGSRHKNMKELRPGSQGRSEVRILFAFDPARQAIMLAAGNKAGRWTQWYDEKIKAADEMFAEHLAQFEDTKPKRRKRKKG